MSAVWSFEFRGSSQIFVKKSGQICDSFEFHTEIVKVLDVTVQILVATATLFPGFVHPCVIRQDLLTESNAACPYLYKTIICRF